MTNAQMTKRKPVIGLVIRSLVIWTFIRHLNFVIRHFKPAPSSLGKKVSRSKFLDSRGRKPRFFARLPTADRGFRPRLLKIFLLQRFFPKLFGATATRGDCHEIQCCGAKYEYSGPNTTPIRRRNSCLRIPDLGARGVS